LAIVSSSLFSHQRSESYSKIVIDKNQEISDIQIEFSLQTQVLQRLDVWLLDRLGKGIY
jgi:hypothetical protein